MHLIKRSLKVLPLALVAASLMASPAMAADPATATCQFGGLTGSLNPPVPPVTRPGGSGNFTFGGSATCVVTHGTTSASVTATISASGSYRNDICGTGEASGTATVTFGPGSPVASATATFSIRFVAGVGVLTISAWADSSGHRGQGGGQVTIVPTGGSCTAEPGVTQFTVAGGFTAAGTH